PSTLPSHFSGSPHHLPSFPTRRSSDLTTNTCISTSPTTPATASAPAISRLRAAAARRSACTPTTCTSSTSSTAAAAATAAAALKDRKSTRLNSSHVSSSYAVFCLKKKR